MGFPYTFPITFESGAQDPYEIWGQAGNPGSGIAITVTNETTGEYEVYTTDSTGTFSVDISVFNPNFPTGYTDGDLVSATALNHDPGYGTVDTIGEPTGLYIALVYNLVGVTTDHTVWSILTEVEMADGGFYYPKTTEAVIRSTMPYDVWTAQIRVAEAITELSNISIYDSVTLYIGDFRVFTGKIDTWKSQYSKQGAFTDYSLSDHGQVLKQIMVSSAKSWTSSTAIGTIIENLRSSFVSSDLTGSNISAGPNISSYNIPAWSKDILSVYQELAKIAGYNLWVDFDKDIHFSAKATTPTDKFSIQEGGNLVAITGFEFDAWGIRNYVKVFGDTGYSAYAENPASQTAYHKREFPYTDPSLTSNAACQEVATALLQPTPEYRISCTVLGDFRVAVGDYIQVEIPRLDISDAFYVTSVEHRINKNIFETNVEIGTQLPDIMRIIASANDRIKKIEGAYV